LVVRITLENQSGRTSFIALAAPWVTIPMKTCTKLNLTYGQTVSILELKPIQPHACPTFKAMGESVDMLSLIPSSSIKGYPLYVDEYEESGKRYLRIWYHHPRGAARQIELKRHVDMVRLGHLLGQLQAEGDKKNLRVAFKNASITEHGEFVSGLIELGLSLTTILARCVFNPTKLVHAQEKVIEYSNSYFVATGVEVSSHNACPTMKGFIAAETFIRSSILATLLIHAMDEVRRGTAENDRFRQAFLAKLLSGDGTLDVRKTPHRLDVRINIVDQNLEYLADYARILAKEGFIAHVIPGHITVRAYCTWLNLITLYQISAFRGNRNWTKLLCAIMIQINGRENQGYRRVQELSRFDRFTSADVSSNYSVGLRSANLWIGTMLRKGLLEKVPKIGGLFKNYRVSAKGMQMARTLDNVEQEFTEICRREETGNPEDILQRTKMKVRRTNSGDRNEAVQR